MCNTQNDQYNRSKHPCVKWLILLSGILYLFSLRDDINTYHVASKIMSDENLPRFLEEIIFNFILHGTLVVGCFAAFLCESFIKNQKTYALANGIILLLIAVVFGTAISVLHPDLLLAWAAIEILAIVCAIYNFWKYAKM